MAITKFDQFDFLIDIVPRDELKPPKRQVSCSQGSNSEVASLQYLELLHKVRLQNVRSYHLPNILSEGTLFGAPIC